MILTISTWLAALPSSAHELPSKTSKCWVLEQKNKFFGDCRVYATSKALKFMVADNKWVDLAKAPNWDVYLLGPQAHVYYRFDLNKFRGHILLTVISAIDTHAKPLKTKEERTIAGITTAGYSASRNVSVRGEVERTEYWVAKDLGLPPQVAHIICADMNIPDLAGLPIRMTADRGREGKMVIVDTIRAKQMYVPDNFFDLPQGYKLVKKPEDIMIGGATELLEDYIK